MKMAKSHKLILLILTAVLSFVAAISFVSATPNKAYAADSSSYISGATSSFSDDLLKVNVSDGTEFSFKNKLVIDDFALEFLEPQAEITEVTFLLTSDSYYVTGNIDKDGKLQTSVVNEIKFQRNDTTWKLFLNDDEAAKEVNVTDKGSGKKISLQIALEGNYLLISADGGDGNVEVNGAASQATDKTYYRIRTIDKPVASFKVKIAATGDAEFNLISIDQKTLDDTGAFKQTFVDASTSIKYALPRVKLSEDLFTVRDDGSFEMYAYNGTEYTLSPSVYSFCGNYTASNIRLREGVVGATGGSIVIPDASSKNIYFNKTSDWGDAIYTFKTGTVSGEDFNLIDEFNVTVTEKDVDENAPVFTEDEGALESFELALKNQYFVEATDDVPAHSVVLGNDITLPSFKSLVFDDYCAYNNLKYTLYYGTPNESSVQSSSSKVSSGSIKINLAKAGDYVFTVLFKDANSNAMEKEDYLNDDVFEESDFVFKFSVNDDAPINVKSPTGAIGDGLVGTKYKAVSFDIEGSGFNTEYKLFYNSKQYATEDDTGWVEIMKSSNANKDNFEDENYTYDQIKSIGYDGSLNFTPDKKGTYKITCTVSSKVSSYRFATASQLIKVNKESKEVYPSSELSTKNVWAIVFLSVGTICLIAIIVLLFVKPKDKTVSEISTKPADKSDKKE